MEEQTTYVDTRFEFRKHLSKILEIILLTVLIIGVAILCYQFIIANQAVRELLSGDPSKLLELYTKTTGNECLIVHP
jgi:hypothetical protein